MSLFKKTFVWQSTRPSVKHGDVVLANSLNQRPTRYLKDAHTFKLGGFKNNALGNSSL